MSPCDNCDGEPATLSCDHCAEGVDINGDPVPKVVGCSEYCMDQHWAENKRKCREKNYRKRLYRAGELLQKIFFNVRRQAFGYWICDAERKDGKLFLVPRISEPWEKRIGIYKFPSDRFQDAKDEHAALALNGCSDAISRFYDLLRKALEDSYETINDVVLIGPGDHIYAKLKEERCVENKDITNIVLKDGISYRVEVKGPSDHIRVRVKKDICFPDGPEPNHEVFRITLRDGNVYAFDLSGAQYGYPHTVRPWTDYRNEIGAHTIKTDVPSGMYAANEEMKGRKLIARNRLRVYDPTASAPVDRHEMYKMVLEWIDRIVDGEVRSWTERKGLSISALLDLPSAEYALGRDELAAVIEDNVRAFVKWLRKPQSIYMLLTTPKDDYTKPKKLEKYGETTAQMLQRVAQEDRLQAPTPEDESVPGLAPEDESDEITGQEEESDQV